MSLSFKQLIPNGVYRIRSAKPGKDDRYLEYQDNGEFDVRPIPSNPTADTQKWQITGNTGSSDVNTYTLTNIASKYNLSFNSGTDRDGNSIWRIKAYSDGSVWTIEPRDSTFVIGWEGGDGCVDYADSGTEDWLLLWDRNNQSQQRWFLEPVNSPDVTPVPAKIKIANFSADDIEVRVTNVSGGSADWYTIAAGSYDTWGRSGSEDVIIRVKGSGTQEPGAVTTGVVAASGSVVRYSGPDHPGLIVTS